MSSYFTAPKANVRACSRPTYTITKAVMATKTSAPVAILINNVAIKIPQEYYIENRLNPTLRS